MQRRQRVINIRSDIPYNLSQMLRGSPTVTNVSDALLNSQTVIAVYRDNIKKTDVWGFLAHSLTARDQRGS